MQNEQVVCPVCGASFANKAACSAHRRKLHGEPGRFAGVFGSMCFCCGTEFHTTTRLCLHLQKVRCGDCFTCSDTVFSAENFVDDPMLAEKPAVQVAYACPFWATLRPVDSDHTANGILAMNATVRSYNLLRSCRSFQDVLGCLVSVARFKPQLLTAGFHLPYVPLVLSSRMLSVRLYTRWYRLPTWDFKLSIQDCRFIYGPHSFNFAQLGVSCMRDLEFKRASL